MISSNLSASSTVDVLRCGSASRDKENGPVKQQLWRSALLTLVLFSACNKPQSATGPHATVLLRDGTSVSGAVVSSSASEVQVLGDDKVAHTIPMSQVRSIDYGEVASAPASAPATSTPAPTTPAPTTPATATPSATTPAAPAAAPGRGGAASGADLEHVHPQASAITTRTSELAAGTQISVRTEETIDSGRAVEGQTFAAEVSRDVLDSNGDVVIPRGANAQIVIKSASKGGRIRGASDLVLDLASVSVEGRRYELNTRDIVRRGKAGLGKNERTAKYTAGGAAVGAIIGAIAGGGKGAAIGAGSGAGAGATAQVLTKGDSVKVPVESILTFRLDSPLRVVAASAP
jgi:hypothetical protein